MGTRTPAPPPPPSPGEGLNVPRILGKISVNLGRLLKGDLGVEFAFLA